MTDKLRNHSVNPIAKRAFLVKTALTALLSASVLSQPVSAAETQWWFDVEVILFERNLEATDISEKFPQSQLTPPQDQHLDLLSPYLHPDLRYLRAGLDYCRASNRNAVQAQYEQSFAFPSSANNENEPESSQQQSLAVGDNLSTYQDEVPVTNVSEASDNQSFEYQVATTDIFNKVKDHNPVAESSNINEAIPVNEVDQDINENSEQAKQLEATAELNVSRPPINVEFIEWQIPKQLPCAYSEQIDPSFASLSYLQESQDLQQQTSVITQVPVVIDGIEWPQKRSASLLPKSTLRMNDLYQKIRRQRNIEPILHLSWRQQVHFGRENSQTVRLFAGQNYGQQFDAQGFPLITANGELNNPLQAEELYIPQQELALLSPQQQQALFTSVDESQALVTQDLFSQIDEALADNTPIDFSVTSEKPLQQNNNSDSTLVKELWQLDGAMTVYLRRVGRVPYLHIDSNFDYRQPVFDPKKPIKTDELTANSTSQGLAIDSKLPQANFLQSVNFNQLRRVISKQVHYFDHPLFGMIVRITRYRWPEVPEDSEIQDNE